MLVHAKHVWLRRALGRVICFKVVIVNRHSSHKPFFSKQANAQMTRSTFRTIMFFFLFSPFLSFFFIFFCFFSFFSLCFVGWRVSFSLLVAVALLPPTSLWVEWSPSTPSWFAGLAPLSLPFRLGSFSPFPFGWEGRRGPSLCGWGKKESGNPNQNWGHFLPFPHSPNQREKQEKQRKK